MGLADMQIAETSGYLVADASGWIVGRVERPLFGASPGSPEAVIVRSRAGFLTRRRIVPADSIEAVDCGARVIGIRVDSAGGRSALQLVGWIAFGVCVSTFALVATLYLTLWLLLLLVGGGSAAD